jgi:hypothetical protein
VHHGGGGGSQPAIAGQPHALAGLAHDPGSALFSQDSVGLPLPVPSGQGPEAVPDARRSQPRRSPRREKRTV